MRLERIGRESLSRQARERLKLYFVKNRLKPGDAIPTEHELAAGLDISRTAVREALKSLESLGIIEVKPGVGRFLKRFNFDAIMENLSYGIAMDVADFSEILDVRIALEAAFLDRYVGHYDAEQIRELRDIVDSMRRLQAEGAGEPAMIRVHTLFHQAPYRHQGNRLLLSLIRMFATIQRSLAATNRYHTQDIRQFIEAHSALVDAIERGDGAEVKRKLLEHFQEALQWSTQAMEAAGRLAAGARQTELSQGAEP
jgi:DNA-binding FadR family transcriptional regulator